MPNYCCRLAVTAWAFVVVVINVVGPTEAALAPGTILVTDSRGAIYSVDRHTGDRTILSGFGVGSGPALGSPISLTVNDRSEIYIANITSSSQADILRIDPDTGNRMLVSATMPGVTAWPRDLTFAPNGQLVGLSDQYQGPNGENSIFTIDLDTGERTIVFEVTDNEEPGLRPLSGSNITFDHQGNILYPSNEGLLSIDPAGNRTLISDLDDLPFDFLSAIVTDKAESIFVSPLSGIFEVDRITGDITRLTDTGFNTFDDLALDHLGNILAIGSRSNRLIAIDPETGDQTIVSGGPVGDGPLFEHGLSHFLAVVPAALGDLDIDGDVDDADFGLAFAAFTGPGGGTPSNPAADLDGDGDVDDADFAFVFAGFTGPLAALNVPEPNALALLVVSAALIARQRRR